MIVAHRGASYEAPENTMEAFRLAWEQGADAIEGDFHLTKDRQIVCIHDRNTERVSNTNIVVSTSTLSELRALDVSLLHGEAPHGGAFKGVVIPTIEEVFSTIPQQKSIYIEIKCGTEIIAPLLEAMMKTGLKSEQVLVISFHSDVLEELKTQAPQYKTSLLRQFRMNESGASEPSLEVVLETLARIKADGLSSDIAIPETVVKAIKAHGYEWHVWTVDDLETAMHIQARGVTSITTNRPGYMRSATCRAE